MMIVSAWLLAAALIVPAVGVIVYLIVDVIRLALQRG
jgi:hypothetical protein